MRRFYQANILRAAAIILVMIYHFWVVSGYQTTGIGVLNNFIGFGGEIGVTIFFILSGFGITCSLFSAETRGEKTSFWAFMKKRLIRIYPQYILSMVFALLIGAMDDYSPGSAVTSLVLHMFFLHNFSAAYHGTVSGVLWTMGVIFQFYLLALPMYALMKKKPAVFLAVSVILTVAIKAIVFGFFIPADDAAAIKYFVYGRQIFTAFDNFALGMVIAYWALGPRMRGIGRGGAWAAVLATAASLFVWLVFISPKITVYSNSLWGYCWHSVTALIAGLLLFTMLLLSINEKSLLYLPFDFISRYEYGIYLFHLLLANLLVEVSPLFKQLAASYWRFTFVMLIVSISVGWLSARLAEGK